MHINSNIIVMRVGRYCVVVKADIPKCDNHVDASQLRFHSHDNRLKGDRRNRIVRRGRRIPQSGEVWECWAERSV